MAYSSGSYGRPRKNRRPRLLLVLSMIVLVLCALAFWRIGAVPDLAMTTDVPGIGTATRVVATATEPSRGLGDLELELIQGERSWTLGESSFLPRPFWAFWGEREKTSQLEALVDGGTLDGLEEGEATLRWSATRASTWIRHPEPTVVERVLPVRFRPPTLDLGASTVSLRQGGAGLVVYRVGDTAASSGVLAGGRFFPGFAVPGGGTRDRFSLFAVPYDSSDPSQIRLVARDDLGNELRSRFVSTFTAKPLKSSKIRLNERFLEKVVGEISSRTAGLSPGKSLLEGYLAINGDLRAKNSEELRKLAADSAAEFFWTTAFRQQPNSQLMDDFAARRTYTFNGQDVDTQDHLGFDLASVRRAPIVSANRGRVALARYFGIYGNTVVVDHGYGLQSLYAHLSSIAVEEGELVEQGQTVGRSGETGLAGGDHLHFAMLIGGEPVDPLEWFDRRWIESRVAAALPSAALLR